METINIEGTEDTPKIILDADSGKFEISERSFPEDVMDFYSPVIDWLNDYSKDPNAKTNFTYRLEYFNTASAKQIFKVMSILENLSKSNEVIISWYYKKGDQDMLASGERYSKLINVKFDLIEY